MTEIERLHQLHEEIEQLELKYDLALNWLFKTRKELITVLSLIGKGKIETIKENFTTSADEGWEVYKEQMNSFDYIVNTLNKKI